MVDLSHKTRGSDSSIYDEVCIYCGATDAAGDKRLDAHCPKSPHVFVDSLHEANLLRDKEWNKEGSLTLFFRTGELFGEAGEAANIMKKLERERLGYVGSRAKVSDLEDELSDVVICTYLVAMHTGINLDEEMLLVKVTEDKLSDYMVAATLLGQRVGAVCGHVEHNWRAHEEKSVTQRRLLINHLVRIMVVVGQINLSFELNVPKRIARKFNASSVKHGLTTFLKVPA